MRQLLAVLILLVASGAEARVLLMTPGRDTFVFDDTLQGQSFKVYTAEGEEAGSDIAEGVFHQAAHLDDILTAVPEARGQYTVGIAMINNAYAVIRQDERFIVIGPNWLPRNAERILVLGHELGHHVCGHTGNILSGDENAWARELEADRLSGLVIRRLVDARRRPPPPGNGLLDDPFAIDLSSAITIASNLYRGGGIGTDHPPADLRINAIVQGYNYGSPCLGRTVQRAGLGGDRSGLTTEVRGSSVWTHNGSVVSLESAGVRRKFIYVTPRAGLPVQKGTLLFDGIKDGETYKGTAYVFSCGARGYSVQGPVSNNDQTITLTGGRELVNASCRSVGYGTDTLVFKYLRQRF